MTSSLIGTFRKSTYLLKDESPLRWAALVGLAVVVSLFEVIGTVLVFALLAVVVGGGEESSLPIPLLKSMRTMGPGLDEQALMMLLGAAVAGFFIVRGAVIVGQSYVQFRTAEVVGSGLSARLLAGYLAMPYAFHLQRNSAELIRNTHDGVNRFISEGLVPAIRVATKSLIVAVLMVVLFFASPIATAVALAVFGPSIWILLRLVQPRIQRLGTRAQWLIRRNYQLLQQSLHGVRDIVILGRQGFFVNVYEADRQALARTRYLHRTAGEVPRVGLETGVVLFIVAFLAVIIAGGGAVADAIPVMGIFGYAAVRIMPELNQITTGLNSLRFVAPAIDDIYADLLEVDEHSSSGLAESGDPLPFNESLELAGVSFTYAGERDRALANIDLTIARGESVGIVGPTGSGKSTLIDVVLGLLVPCEGSVTVDGTDIHESVTRWQERLGVVPQMAFFTDDTIRRNVALGVPDDAIDEEAVWRALQAAQLHSFVSGLPRQLDTFVGERGVRISGGQRQRLTVARALYREVDVLIFDEGTSALDRETEAALMASLESLRGSRTLITVAHRLSTVASCDKVVLMKDGSIADEGAYADLVARHTSLQL